MDKINCIIADDEPFALDLLKDYIEKTPFLHLEKACKNAMEVLDSIKINNDYLFFLDVQMPGLNGIQLAKMLQKNNLVIFTTAYESYAIEGYKVNALDYLLKPFSYEEFLTSAIKARNKLDSASKSQAAISGNEGYIIVKTDYKLQQISLSDILYIEGLKDYVKIFLQSQTKPVISLMSMKIIEEKLSSETFMRVHRSYIVNLNKIQTVERSRIIFGNVFIPVSDNYKERFLEFITGRFLQ